MAIKGSATVTLSFMKDVKATYRYYSLKSSTSAKPGVPTEFPPGATAYHEDVFHKYGYTLNQRLGSGGLSANKGFITTGLIPVDMTKDVYRLRIKGLSDSQMGYATAVNNRIGYYGEDGTTLYLVRYIWDDNQSGSNSIKPIKDGDDYVMSILEAADGWKIEGPGTIKYIRLCFDLYNNKGTTVATDDDADKIKVLDESYYAYELSTWQDSEPSYTSGSTNTLYYVDCTVFSDDTFIYTPVSVSSSYEASKEAYNKALNAEGVASNANNKIDNLQVGGRNLIQKDLITNVHAEYQMESTDHIVLTSVSSSNGSMLLFNVTLDPGTYTINATGSVGGKTHRLVADIQMDSSWKANTLYENNGHGYYKNVTMPHTFETTSPLKMGMVFLGDHGLQTITGLKLEKGNKATDWTPAPEDKVSTDKILASINASGETVKIQGTKIQLEGTITANNNFKVNTDGTIEAVNGKFSGVITAEKRRTVAVYDGEVEAIRNYIMGEGSLTDEQLIRLDINQDGEITSSDYVNAKSIYEGVHSGNYVDRVNMMEDGKSVIVLSSGTEDGLRKTSTVITSQNVSTDDVITDTLECRNLVIKDNTGEEIARFGDELEEHSGELVLDTPSILIRGTVKSDNVTKGDLSDMNFVAINYGLSEQPEDTGLRVKRIDTDRDVFFGIGSGGTSAGFYDRTLGGWIVLSDPQAVILGLSSRTLNLAGTTVKLQSSGATVTSDKHLKDNISRIDDKYIDFFNKLQPITHTYRNGNSGRKHLGFIAQDVESALAESGLTNEEFAGLCIDVPHGNDDLDDKYDDNFIISQGINDKIYSLRYHEFTALNTYMIQKNQDKIAVLNEEINRLKQLLDC